MEDNITKQMQEAHDPESTKKPEIKDVKITETVEVEMQPTEITADER